jgi:hypothetical protein
MRDDPWDASLRFRSPVDTSASYQQKHLESSKELLARLEAATPEERLAIGVADRADSIERYKGYVEKQKRENKIFNEMLAQVNAWTPPTPDHAELKKFMTEQLETSLHDTTYYERQVMEAEERDPADYYEDEVSACKREIEYYKKQIDEKLNRKKTFDADLWIASLCDSLGVPHPEKPCESAN